MSLYEAFVNAYDDRFMRLVGQAVTEALAPWNPGRITIWQDEWMGRHPGEIVLGCDVELFPTTRFLANVDRLKTEEAVAAAFAQEAFNFYRNRPALPVDDHIILGEE